MVPYQSNRFHYTWHWWYNFGTGDMGNDGVHDLDVRRRLSEKSVGRGAEMEDGDESRRDAGPSDQNPPTLKLKFVQVAIA